MGKRLGSTYSRIKKWFYRYNAENRAYKYIEKQKLPAAPQHPGTEKLYDKLKTETSHIYEEITQKNLKLDKHLQKVYVKSEGKNEEIRTSKPLPQNRFYEELDSVFKEPAETSEGHATLSKIVKFISDHRGDPKLWSADSVAKSYKLDKNKVDNVLKYYKTFNLYVPDVEAEETTKEFAKRIVALNLITGKSDETKEDNSKK